MKKTISTLALLAAGLLASAAPRTAEEALQVARQFVAATPALQSVKSMQMTLSPSIAARAKSREGLATQTSPAYYVVNLSDDNGFVVVSGDDRFTPVLGYSTSGNISNADELPDGLAYWLASLQGEMETAIANGYEAAQTPARVSVANAAMESVEPLVTTKWGQKTPYNKLIPNFATGCVATGMAQVMKYWNYPTKGVGQHANSYHTDYTANFDATTYDWANMLDTYGSGFEEDFEVMAVATLMRDLGIATDMRWTKDNSGTPNAFGAYALTHFFGYNKYLYVESRDCLSTGAWKAIILDELHNGRPLCYAGTSEENGTEGHFFVLDGYDANTGLFHFNWGWDGRFDGYFNISALNPGGEGMAGAVTGSYNYHQQIFVNVQPETTGSYTARFNANRVAPQSSTSNGNKVTIVTYQLANSALDFVGTIGLAVYNADGTLSSYQPSEVQFPGPLTLGSNYSGAQDFTMDISDVKDGTYTVCLAVLHKDYPATPYPVSAHYGNPTYYTMKKAGTTITFAPVADAYVIDAVSAPQLLNSKEEATAYENVPATFSVKVKNTGSTEYYDEVGVCIQLGARDSQRQYITVPCQLAPGEEKTVTLKGKILRSPGEYSVVACYVEGSEYVRLDAKSSLTVKDEASAISSVSSTTANDAVYTLSGVRLNSNTNLSKGIYIKGGKKIIVK